MSQPRTDTEAYQQHYLPWAAALIESPAATGLIERVNADRIGLINSTVLFRPKLDRLTAKLTLLANRPGTDKEVVNLVADFEQSQLKSIGLNSIREYLVTLNLNSPDWPVVYNDSHFRSKDELAYSEHYRQVSERLVVGTADALRLHMEANVPIGQIPEESHDWSLQESELNLRTLNNLRKQGINTYGDLGVLSLNQLEAAEGIKDGTIAEIKAELARVGWLSPAHH